MNQDPPGTAGSDGTGNARWWLDPALAQLAFGNRSLHGAASPTRPLGLLSDAALELDLDDPNQRDFGDYLLLEQLDRGGMGVIYRARQKSLGREVAIKLLAAGPWASDEFISSFQHEAQHAAQLQHPNIVAVYDLGTHDGLSYYAMQLVLGSSLAQRLEHDGPLPPRDAARLLQRIAGAVDYAHRLGTLHLDLKPGNVLLDERDEPLVADFGMARRLEQALGVDNDRVSGTPSYMAPEQARAHGAPLSRATDIYGLGAVLYELLTGRPPFLADSPRETLERVVAQEPVAPRRLDPRIPRDLDAIVLRCLAKAPGARYPDAHALTDDLTRFLEDRAVSVRPLNTLQRLARWARREPRVATVAGLALTALLIGVVTTTVQWRRAETNANTASTRLWESRREAALRLEMDGYGFNALPMLLSNIQEQEHAGRDDLAALERRRIGILFARAPTLLDVANIDDASLLSAALSPDGSLLALGFNDMTVRWYGTDALRERGRIDLTGVPRSYGDYRAPMLLRFVDNRRLRVTLDWLGHYASAPGSDSHLLDLQRGERIKPPPQFTDLTDITYSADGRHALLRNRQAQIQLWQVAPWQPLSPLAQTAPGGLPWLLGPGAHYAATVATRELLVFDPHDLSQPRRIELPGDSSISTWAESRNGRWLALGSFDGRVLMLDTRDWSLRQMPSPLGRQTQWLAFSEDDAWLAVASLLGIVYTFDVETGDALAAGEMRHDFTLGQVVISHRQRMLVATGDGRVGIWRLPTAGPQTREAKRLSASPSGDPLASFFGVGFSADSGLLANTSLDGAVGLWRLPHSTRLPARAPYWRPEVQHYDGRRVVDVAWNRLRLLSTRGAAASAWITLPQPPVFAELVGPGHDLVVVSGRALHVYDAATLRLRYPSRPLPETPIRFAASDDGASLILGFAGNGADGPVERLESWNLRDGRRRAAITLAGPLRQLQLSPDGRRVVVISNTHAIATVLQTRTLRRVGEYQADADTPPIWASFGPTADIVYLAVRARDPRLDNDAVLVWDAATQRLLERRPTFRALPIGVANAAGRPFVAGRNLNLLDPGRPGARVLPRLSPRVEPLARIVASHGGTLLAQAFHSEVQLYDAASGDPVGPPLVADGNGVDVISQIAFSPDDRELLARSTQGYWWRFPIAPDLRPLAAIRHQAERLSRRGAGRPAVPQQPLDAAEHATLRARDPGPWRSTSAPRPASPRSGYGVAGLPIPARAAGMSPLLLDLAPACNAAPDTVMDPTVDIFSEMRSITAPGVASVDGVDYDVRCAVLLYGLGNPLMPGRSQSVARGIGAPALPIAAFHVLLLAAQPTPAQTGLPYARLRVHYRDGSSAVLTLRSGREVSGNSGQDQGVRVAWTLHDPVHLFGSERMFEVDNPRLPNPHPERPVASVDLESVEERWSAPVFFAITAEAAADATRRSR